MIAGAIFDLDGTLLDSVPIWNSAAAAFLSGMGIAAEPRLANIMFSMSMTQGAEFLKARYHLDIGVDAISAGINHTIEDFYNYQVQLKDGAEHFLRDMQQAGIKMTAATSSDRQVVERALERLKVIDLLGRIFTCTEIGAGKIKPDIYLAAAEHMGTMPQDTWVFEDALHAVQTAKKAGFRTVGVYDDFSREDWAEIERISDIGLKKLGHWEGFWKKASLY